MAGAAAGEKAPPKGGAVVKEEKGEIDEKTLALLAYVLSFVSGIIVFVIGKTRLSKFHGMQAFLLGIAAWVVYWILTTVWWGLWNIASLITGLVWLYGLFIGLTKAYKGIIYKMPFVGEYADQFSK